MSFFATVDQTEVQHVFSNTYMFLLYALIMFVMYYIANWIWLWTMRVENAEKTYVTMWKENNQHTIIMDEQMVLKRIMLYIFKLIK